MFLDVWSGNKKHRMSLKNALFRKDDAVEDHATSQCPILGGTHLMDVKVRKRLDMAVSDCGHFGFGSVDKC